MNPCTYCDSMNYIVKRNAKYYRNHVEFECTCLNCNEEFKLILSYEEFYMEQKGIIEPIAQNI